MSNTIPEIENHNTSDWRSQDRNPQISDSPVVLGQVADLKDLHIGPNSQLLGSRAEIEDLEVVESGYLELFLGPMFAGKTLHLVTELTKMADLGLKVLYINFKGDDRSTEGGDGFKFSSHNSSLLTLSSRISSTKVSRLSEVEVSGFDVVGLDEANFYPDLLDSVLHWVGNHRLRVYVAGLDGDYLKRPLGDVLLLIPHADRYVKVSACCLECLEESRNSRKSNTNGTSSNGRTLRPSHFSKAPFTKRKVDSQLQLLVGGSNYYSAVCRRHHS